MLRSRFLCLFSMTLLPGVAGGGDDDWDAGAKAMMARMTAIEMRLTAMLGACGGGKAGTDEMLSCLSTIIHLM